MDNEEIWVQITRAGTPGPWHLVADALIWRAWCGSKLKGVNQRSVMGEPPEADRICTKCSRDNTRATPEVARG